VAAWIPCGPEVKPVADVSVSDVALVWIGHDLDEFLEFAQDELLPAVRVSQA
jgi:hypothetical protein